MSIIIIIIIIIIINSNSLAFRNNINEVFQEINEWFQSNLLSLNYDKSFVFFKFVTKKNQLVDTQIFWGNKYITNIHSTRFLGLNTDTSLSWKYIRELKSKLNQAHNTIRSIKPFLCLGVIGIIYFSYVHSVLSYGKIFWGNSSYSKSIFKIQKRMLCVIMSYGRRDSCCELFRQLNILPLKSQC